MNMSMWNSNVSGRSTYATTAVAVSNVSCALETSVVEFTGL